MKDQVNFSHLIAVIIGIVIPSLFWINSVEKFKDRVKSNESDIKVLKTDLKESSKNNQINFDKVLLKLHSIELSVKDKKDRE